MYVPMVPLIAMLTMDVLVATTEIAFYYGTMFERLPAEECRGNWESGLQVKTKCLSECSLVCEDKNCRRFMFCSQRHLCVLGKEMTQFVDQGDCSCLAKKVICYNGGTNQNDVCLCRNGFYGDLCQHVIKDCTDGKERHLRTGDNMLTWIKPHTVWEPFQVSCDFDYGYTYSQRRPDIKNGIDFRRGWDDYVTGFGDLHSDHWLGLEKIHILTSSGLYNLEVNLETENGQWGHVYYCPFRVGGLETNYTLYLGDPYPAPGEPTLSDSFRETPSLNISGKPFSTFDHDSSISDCPGNLLSGFWFGDSCTSGNVNGPYASQHQVNTDPLVPRASWGGVFRNMALRKVLLRSQRKEQC